MLGAGPGVQNIVTDIIILWDRYVKLASMFWSVFWLADYVLASDMPIDLPDDSPFFSELYQALGPQSARWTLYDLARALHVHMQLVDLPEPASLDGADDERSHPKLQQVLLAWSAKEGKKATAEAFIMAVHRTGRERLAAAMASWVKVSNTRSTTTLESSCELRCRLSEQHKTRKPVRELKFWC